MAITENLETIINARYGRDVRQAIHDGLKQAYEDGTANGNANMEVSMARGSYATLASRLDASDDKLTSTTSRLAQTEQQLDETTAQLAQKVDKNGNEQVTWAMASQDFKEQITGGNTAVVGVNSVNTTNIVDEAVTARKRTVISDGVIVQAPHPDHGKIPNLDTKNKTLTFYRDTTFFYRGNRATLSENTTIDLSLGESSSKKVYYDVVTNVFKVYEIGRAHV